MITEDFGIFLEDFGEVFIHETLGEFKAIFKDAHTASDYQMGVSMQSPELFVFRDMANQMFEAEVVTRQLTGVSYILSDFQPDGTGGVKIRVFEA